MSIFEIHKVWFSFILIFQGNSHAYVLLLYVSVRHYLPLISPCFHIYPHHYHNNSQNSMCFVVCSLQFPSILSTWLANSLHKDSIFGGSWLNSHLGSSLKFVMHTWVQFFWWWNWLLGWVREIFVQEIWGPSVWYYFFSVGRLKFKSY